MSRSARLEIPKRVKLEVFARAGGPDNVCCEGCSLRLGGKAFDYDHTIAEGLRALQPSERTISADDVKLLGRDCCHKPKTRSDIAKIAHTNRLIDKAAKVKRKSSFQTNRDGPWRKKMNGEVVPR